MGHTNYIQVCIFRLKALVIDIYFQTHRCMCTCACVCMCVCVYMCTCVRVRVCVCVCVCTCVYECTCMCYMQQKRQNYKPTFRQKVKKQKFQVQLGEIQELTATRLSACVETLSKFACGIVNFPPLSVSNTPPPPAARRKISILFSFVGVRHSMPII